jgi:hypothetical protein
MKIQDWYCQGMIASSPQPAPDRRGRYRRGDPIGDNLRGQVRAAPPRQWQTTGFGWPTGERFDRGDLDRGEGWWPTRSSRIAQRRGTWLCPPEVTPLADGVHAHSDPRGDLRVGQSLGGQQYDPCPRHQLLRCGAGPDQVSQPLLLGGFISIRPGLVGAMARIFRMCGLVSSLALPVTDPFG